MFKLIDGRSRGLPGEDQPLDAAAPDDEVSDDK
jgi:hypothetical protein